MPDYLIRIACVNGHTEEIKATGTERRWVETYAALLEGTSPFYVRRKKEREGVIGSCGVCGSQIKCQIIELEASGGTEGRVGDRS